MNNEVSIKNKKSPFFDLFKTGKAVLKVKHYIHSEDEVPKEVQIENKIENRIDLNGFTKLEEVCKDLKLDDFLEFYPKYNGFSIGNAIAPKHTRNVPLLYQLPLPDLFKHTELYLPNGKWAWTIDCNKSKKLYRGDNKWLVLAIIEGGPACLTIFLEGEHAGNIFYLTPRPHFNFLRPIAKSFTGYLERIAKDPAAFLKLIRADMSIYKKEAKCNYNYVVVAYNEA